MAKAEPRSPAALVDPAVANCPGACPRPVADRVVLLSGVTVCTYCPAWKEETFALQVEAYAVLAMDSKPRRVAHLDAREQAYGPAYRARLSAVVLDSWERRRAAAAAAAEVAHG
jgi:hypothetical protein